MHFTIKNLYNCLDYSFKNVILVNISLFQYHLKTCPLGTPKFAA